MCISRQELTELGSRVRGGWMGACVSPMVFHTTHPFYRHLPPHTAIQKLPRCHGEQIGAASCLPRAILGRKVGGMAEDG